MPWTSFIHVCIFAEYLNSTVACTHFPFISCVSENIFAILYNFLDALPATSVCLQCGPAFHYTCWLFNRRQTAEIICCIRYYSLKFILMLYILLMSINAYIFWSFSAVISFHVKPGCSSEFSGREIADADLVHIKVPFLSAC